MKKITSLLPIVFTAISSFSQITIIEGLDDGGAPTGWTSNGFNDFGSNQACSGVGILSKNFWQYAALGSLTSPNFVAVSNGTDVTVNFQWKAREYATGDGVGFTVNAQFSTDGGLNYQNIGAPIVATGAQGCTLFAATIPAALVPNGSDFSFKIAGTWSAGDCYFDVDAIAVTQVASAPPACVLGATSVPDALCGNFAVPLSWQSSVGAIGYKITMGTTPGSSNVLNNFDLGSATSYNFSNPLTLNTTYYWKVVPYNGAGSSVGCTENSFTTATAACFCTPSPTSVDGQGITNVTIGTINNETIIEAGNYGDYSALITNVSQGISTPFAITYQTNASYDTKIWVDWNNDSDFDDAGENVYTGVSLSGSPSLLSGSFVVPASASLGNHRMRVGGADFGNVTPCYSGSYASFEDYTLNVVAATCVQPVATASFASCNGTQYTILVNVTALGDGTPSITDGITSIPVTTVGNYTFGPINLGTSLTLNLLHGSNAICNVPLGVFNYQVCPPTNDDCSTALTLTPAGDYQAGSILTSNEGATTSSTAAPTTCFGYNGGDVWFSTTIPASGSITIQTGDDGNSIDTVIAIYSGTNCGALTQIGCNDDGGGNGYSKVILTGRTPGENIVVRAYSYANNNFGSFKISAFDASLSASSFNLDGFAAYPNPVKDVLNLSYTQDISKVSIYNLVGQEIITKVLNAKQSQVDMSSLTNGTYIVKVTVGDMVKTLKVMKQ